MKKFLHENSPILILFILWRFGLALIERFVVPLWPLRTGFLGPVAWANMDGTHYLSIVKDGYFQYEQAFFPLYPYLIKHLYLMTDIQPYIIALVISHVTFLLALMIFFKLFAEINKNSALYAVIFLLLFPCSFFFAAVYNESLFLFLAMMTTYSAKKRWWLVSGIMGMLASTTRLFGVLLFPLVLAQYFIDQKKRNIIDVLWIFLIPMGLIGYLYYLWSTFGDPLAFFHSQPAFGAGRSGSSLIFLPQVIWRYMKIFTTVPLTDLAYQVAIFELLVLVGGLVLCLKGWSNRNMRVYVLYSAAVLIIPTLTGTLSSLPRYLLSAFPLFFVLGSMHNTRLKVVLAVVFIVGLIYFASAFLRGYFVA